MLGVGEYVDGIIEFPTLQMTQGARFGTNFAPEDVEIVDWGSMSMELGCDAGMVGYASTIASIGAGEQDLARLSHLAGPGCPYEAPRLTDLYNAEWLEIPLPEDGAIDVRRVSDDGTVIGMRALEDRDEGEIVVLPPGSEQWLTLPAQAVLRDGPVLFSPGSGRIIATEAPDNDFSEPFEPVGWWPESGWGPIAGMNSAHSLLTGGSRDASILLGRRYAEGDPQSQQVRRRFR